MFLNTPLGQVVDNLSPDDILELLGHDDNYWSDGSGSASLSVDSVDKSNEILMFYRESKYGYVVLQMDDHKALMDEEKDKNHIIVHNIGGEPFPVPLCFF